MLGREWLKAEARKGHGFRPVPLKVLIAQDRTQPTLPGVGIGCACFGGDDDFAAELESEAA